MSLQLSMFDKVNSDRDIPMQVDESMATKVKTHDTDFTRTVFWDCVPCPNCGRWIALNVYGFNHKYCEHCGQKLSWLNVRELEDETD